MTPAEIAVPHLNANPTTIRQAMGNLSANRLIADSILAAAITDRETGAAEKREVLAAAFAAVRDAEDKFLALL